MPYHALIQRRTGKPAEHDIVAALVCDCAHTALVSVRGIIRSVAPDERVLVCVYQHKSKHVLAARAYQNTKIMGGAIHLAWEG
jgi:hypothetical protein